VLSLRQATRNPLSYIFIIYISKKGTGAFSLRLGQGLWREKGKGPYSVLVALMVVVVVVVVAVMVVVVIP
jgi:hypothetical protein